jgi:hypothetical protein
MSSLRWLPGAVLLWAQALQAQQQLRVQGQVRLASFCVLQWCHLQCGQRMPQALRQDCRRHAAGNIYDFICTATNLDTTLLCENLA